MVEGLDYSPMFDKEIKAQIDVIPKDKFYRIKWDKVFKDQTIKNIKKEPIGYLIFYAKKVVSFLFITIDPKDPRYWNPLHYLPVLLLGITSLIGIVLSDKKSYKFNYLIFVFFLNVFIFSAATILPRYKLIILPLQIIFTNVLIERIVKRFIPQRENN